jgi:type II secretory pathway pseudopilin PulG
MMIAVIGIAAVAQVKVGSLVEQREKEEELLWIGQQFRQALASYSSATPAGKPTLPSTLSQLLLDERFPVPRRHLRKIYVDPMTGKADWVVLTAPGGAIVGIRSQSTAQPIKIAGFPPEFLRFAEATNYAEWVFSVAATPAPPGQRTP